MSKPWAPLAMPLAALALAVGCADSGPEVADGTGALAERLQGGGQVLVLRHAATDSAADMTGDLRDCSRQRNLSAAGRRQARAIGRATRRLDVRVGRVLASPFCRTRDTARLAFGRVRPSRALLSPELASGGAPDMGALLRARPAAGETTVLVSHEAAIDAATGVTVDEGGGVLLVPQRGAREPRVAARIDARDWTRLASR